jgi:hypothetical protein
MKSERKIMKAEKKTPTGKTKAPKPTLNMQFKLTRGAVTEMQNRLTPLPVDVVSATDFLLSHRTMAVKRLKPKVVAQVTLELARNFSIQSDRFRRMVPQHTKTVHGIFWKKFGPELKATHIAILDKVVANTMTGFEITIPASDGYHHGETSVSSTVCLVFGYDGTFFLGEKGYRSNDSVKFTKLDEKKLTALVKRFPDLNWVLTVAFFPHMMEHLMSDIEFAHRHMKDFQKFAQQVAGRLSFQD